MTSRVFFRRPRPRRSWPLRSLAALGAVAALGVYTTQLAHLRQRDPPLGWSVAQRLPLNALSRLANRAANWHVPRGWRRTLYRAYAWWFNGNVDEAELPLEQYASVQQFFTRRLRPDARPIMADAHGQTLVSPSDGTVLHYGRVSADAQLEAVKGRAFSLRQLLGPCELSTADQRALHFCTVYLNPGNYHRFHAPAAMRLDGRRHFPGLLMPVSPIVVKLFSEIFARNERIVLYGRWAQGFMAVVPVGATNVGSIRLRGEPELRTNVSPTLKAPYYERQYAADTRVPAGAELGTFEMGSTVVVVFSAPTSFQFTVQRGQSIEMGQIVGFTPTTADFPVRRRH